MWEYITVRIERMSDGPSVDKTLDVYGKDGWELVSVSEGIAYFKRLLK